MNALDTNILTRYVRDDDPEQSKRAVQFIQSAMRSGDPLFLNHVVICELVWILTSVYDHGKDEIVKMLESILSIGQFELENRPALQSALDDFRRSKADFSDCLIGRGNRSLGCQTTLTFDRRLKGLETFEVR